MTRFGVMKHLRVLERAGIVITRRSGREKLRFLNAVPIRMIHDRWIDKYTERRVSALLELKNELEAKALRRDKSGDSDDAGLRGLHQSSPQAIRDAITSPEWNLDMKTLLETGHSM